MPADVRPYKKTATFTETTVPQGLLKDHATAAGVWVTIHVVSGKLRYVLAASGAEFVLDPDSVGVIAPQERHRVAPIGAVTFFVEFSRIPPPES